MCKDLINMINSASISVDRFFTMDPFSYTNDKQYGKVSEDINFFDDLYVTTNKTFERLATLAQLSIDDSLSALVVTGYSGSGKTNFLKYCEAIIQNKVEIRNYSEVQSEIENLYRISDNSIGNNYNTPTFFDESLKEESVNESKKINMEFSHSINQIKNTLYQRYFNYTNDQIRNDISSFLNNVLKGQTVYFDFDKDKQDNVMPLEIKLTRQIETHLYKENALQIEKAYLFYTNYQKEFTDAFENRSGYLFEKAITFIYNHRNENFNSYKELLVTELKELEIDQLLCMEVILKMSENLSNKTQNIYYFLDNIDMISGINNKVLIDTISEFWDFIKEFQSLIHTIRQKPNISEDTKNWIKTYEKIKYIFSMRETTAMHICDHLRSRISSYAKQFDISMDINKSFIFKKRFDVLKQYIDKNQITNTGFIEMSQCIDTIMEDKYCKWNLFHLFNNDYRKAMECLCAISTKSNFPIYKCLPMITGKDSYNKFGGRGIVIKSLCNSFKKWNYFELLKVPMKSKNTKNQPYNITLTRIILTILDNLQNELAVSKDSFFFIKRENCISLKTLYKYVHIFCDEKTFLKHIENMFSGRTWSYWNHLITFDNILEYNQNELENALKDDCQNEIYIRCTRAGERYLNSFCIHYEFFSCRYASDKNSGLFSNKLTKRNNEYCFEKEIKYVIESVSACCKELHSVNNELMQELGFDELEELLDTHYVKDKKFHEERIIHNHITYLDSFRLYLINGPLQRNIEDINRRLIQYISTYLDLLKYDGEHFYSSNSQTLYYELSYCINAIIEKDYQDTDIIISRTYYRDNFTS